MKHYFLKKFTYLRIRLEIFGWICIYHHHHHHVVPLARISLTLSRHFSLSLSPLAGLQGYIPYPHIAFCMYILAGLPAFARPYVGFHRSISLMSSSLLLQGCPACLVRLTRIVFMMGVRTDHKAPTIRPPAFHHENVYIYI